jgi:hypothetical protein
MSVAEYTAAFVSIMVGLALADLAVSLQRLLRAGPRVRWDLLTPAAALLATGFVINIWWTMYASLSRVERLSVASFIPDLVTLVLLFCLASSALPDAVPDEGLDLRVYYERNRRWLWRLFAAYTVWVTLVVLVRFLAAGATAGQVARATIPNLVLMALMLTLARSGRRALHVAVLAVLLLVTALAWLPQEVRGGAERPAPAAAVPVRPDAAAAQHSSPAAQPG